MRLPLALAACISVRTGCPAGVMLIVPTVVFTPVDIAEPAAAESVAIDSYGWVINWPSAPSLNTTSVMV